MNILDIKRTLDSDSGKALKEYLLGKLCELQNIENMAEKDDIEHQAVEIKAQKRAYNKLREILEECMTLTRPIAEKDPRDSFHIE